MYTIYFEQETGRIATVAMGSAYEEATKDFPTIETDALPASVSDYYVNEGVLTARPTIQEFVGSTLDLTLIPVGSTIRVENEAGDFIEATPEDLTIELTDVGTYVIKVNPPFPCLGFKQTLVVA